MKGGREGLRDVKHYIVMIFWFNSFQLVNVSFEASIDRCATATAVSATADHEALCKFKQLYVIILSLVLSIKFNISSI